jgi:hypothetical protein
MMVMAPRLRKLRLLEGALFALPAAPLLVLAPSPAFAQSKAEQLRADYNGWSAEVSGVLGDMANFRDALLPRYACPPEQPSKQSKLDELNDYTSRLGAARRRGREIEDQRTLLGQAGEGQVGAGLSDKAREKLFGPGAAHGGIISDAEMKQVTDLIARLTQELSTLRQELSDRPPTDEECNPRSDPIANVAFTAPSQEPGTHVQAQISATTASGKPVIISGVTVAGVNEIGTPGAAGGLGTAAATYDFDIEQVRRQGPFNLRVTVTGLPAGFPAGTAPMSMAINVNYEVRNVGPTIESVPDAPKGKPGEAIALTGQVVLIDRNADNRNAAEVTASMIKLAGHPAGLETAPGEAFGSFGTVRQVSHNPATGRYTFQVERTAAVEKPHAHGKFPTKITVADRRGSTGDADIELIVQNVAPTISIRAMPTRHYHSGDGKQVIVVGAVADDNGAADIVDVTVDAAQAGGATYTLTGGSIVKDPGGPEDGFSFQTRPQSFRHTDTVGEWPINGTVRDGGAPEQDDPTPLTADAGTSITVDNLAPTISAYGYISNFGMAPDHDEICPLEQVFVGVLARDPEGDPLTAKAVIVETGAEFPLAIQPGDETFTGFVKAPATAGEYTVRYVVTEAGSGNPLTVDATLKMVVLPCNEPQQEDDKFADPGRNDEPVTVKAVPGSEVKIGPEPPALPGELPANIGLYYDYARLLGWASELDGLDYAYGGDEAAPGSPPLSLIVLGSFFRDLELEAAWKLMEDVGEYPDEPCPVGDGEGPVFEIGDPPPPDPDLEAWEELVRQAKEQSDKLDEAADYPGEDLDFNVEEDIDGEYDEWVDREFGDAAAGGEALAEQERAAAEVRTAERARLDSQYKELLERQDRLEAAVGEIKERLANTDDAAEKAQLESQLAELSDMQDAVSAQTEPVAEALNALDQAAMAATAELRAELSQQINSMAADAIAERIKSDATLQDIKDGYTWGGQWVSTGAKMQRETSGTTRTADRELAAAEEKLKAIGQLEQFAAPGSQQAEMLQEFRGLYEGQAAAAEQMLASNAELSRIGYEIDVLLTITGAKLVQLGKNVIVAGATRAFTTQTAERVIATTTETGLIQLTKSAIGRGTAEGAAASGTANATGGVAARVAGESSEAVTEAVGQAVGSNTSQVVTEAMGQAVPAAAGAGGQVGADVVFRLARGGTTTFRGNVADVLREMAKEKGHEALEQAAQLVEHVAQQLGVTQQQALRHIVEETVGRDVARVAATPEVTAVFDALEAAGQRGIEAFRSPAGQAIAEAAEKRLAEEAARAQAAKVPQAVQQILEQRYGAEGGRGVLERAREGLKPVKDWVDSLDLGSGTFYSLVPGLIALGASQSEAAEAPQATVGPDGKATITGAFGWNAGVKYEFDFTGGGPAYGYYSDGAPPAGTGPTSRLTIGNDNYSNWLSYMPSTEQVLQRDPCRKKKLLQWEAGE